MQRKACIKRETKETQIDLTINLDGDLDKNPNKKKEIQTGVGFFDHMLDLFTSHGNFDLSLKVKGDLHIDQHHTIEDIGIVLGQAMAQALQDKKGIQRYGTMYLPMDEALVRVVVDLSGRPFLVLKMPQNFTGKIGDFDAELIKEFLISFTHNLKATLHIEVLNGENKHHVAEAIFKGLGRALRQAVLIVGNQIPSTKGVL